MFSNRAPTEHTAQQQRKKKHSKETLPQCIPARMNNRRTAKRYTPYRTSPQHRNSALRQQRRKEKYNGVSLPQLHPCIPEQTTYNKKHAPYRTPPKHSGGATQYHHCTNLHARNPSPAPARSAVRRTASVTTGHHPHNVLTTCAAK